MVSATFYFNALILRVHSSLPCRATSFFSGDWHISSDYLPLKTIAIECGEVGKIWFYFHPTRSASLDVILRGGWSEVVTVASGFLDRNAFSTCPCFFNPISHDANSRATFICLFIYFHLLLIDWIDYWTVPSPTAPLLSLWCFRNRLFLLYFLSELTVGKDNFLFSVIPFHVEIANKNFFDI